MLLRTNFLTLQASGLKLLLLRCTKPNRTAIRRDENVRNTRPDSNRQQGDRGSLPRRGERAVLRTGEAGEHQRRRGQERLRGLDRQHPRAAWREGRSGVRDAAEFLRPAGDGKSNRLLEERLRS